MTSRRDFLATAAAGLGASALPPEWALASGPPEVKTPLHGPVGLQLWSLREQLKMGGVVSAFFRTLLTVGALLWFPIIQPLLEAFLDGHTIRNLAFFAVRLFGVTYLLKSVTFLAIYFSLLWLILRWDTQRRIDKFLKELIEESSGSTHF